MTSNSTQFRLTLISLIVFILLGSIGFGVYHIYSENLKTAQLSALSERDEKQEELARTIRAWQENARADIAEFENLGVTSETLVPTIESIETAGRVLGLSTEITSVEREGEGASIQMVKISVISTGAWKGNFSFLKALENLPQRVTIEDAQLSKTGTAWRSQVTLSLQSFD